MEIHNFNYSKLMKTRNSKYAKFMKIHDGDHSPHLSASQMRQKGKKKLSHTKEERRPLKNIAKP